MRIKMSKGLKKFLAAAFAGVLMIGNVLALSVGAEEPYDVYNYDRWGEPILRKPDISRTEPFPEMILA